uniref:Putative agap013105-pa-like protein n=1 Tax=Anopheles darlingi TaxID=43151 RepID=A0A2M4CLH0_ANODA
MWPRTIWIVFLLHTLSILGTNGSEGVSCSFCQSIGNYNTCLQTAKSVECNDALVQMTHLLLSPHNPTLRKDPSMGTVGVGYQCFRVNYTVQDIWNYQMGCTYADNRICQGWKLNTQCSSVPAKVVATTTTMVPSSSTVIPVSNSRKPISAVSITAVPPSNMNRSTTVTMVATTKSTKKESNATEIQKPTMGPVKTNREMHSNAKGYTIEGEFIAIAIALTIWNVFFVQHAW